MARLFDWVYRITAITRATGFIGSSPQFFQNIGNAIEFTNVNAAGIGNRMSFEIKRSLGKEPNSCKIILDNLSDDTKRMLDRKPVGIVLAAGYRDTGPRLLFAGDLMYSFTELKGTNYETVLQVADGGRAYKYGRMSASYKAPVRIDNVLRDCANSFGLTLPPEVLELPQIKEPLPVGFTAHGPTREVLTKVLDRLQLGWSMQNGKLQILPDGVPRAGEAVLIDETTGLIGSPKRTTPTGPKAKSMVEANLLLYPELLPGMKAKIKSRDFDGVFRIKELEAQGDTYGDDWSTKIKCTVS